MICDFDKSKGAIAKPKSSIVTTLQQKINQISLVKNDDVTDSNIMDTVLRKNNFNTTVKLLNDDEMMMIETPINDDSIIKRSEQLPSVICQSENDLQISMTKILCENPEIPSSVPGNEVNMRKDSQVSSGSKIPVFNPSLRISKCSSWACGDISPSPEITDLTPGNFLAIRSF